MALEEMHELMEAEGDEVLGELTDVLNYLAQFAFLAGVSEEQILSYSRWVYDIRNYQKYPPEEDGVISRQNQRAFWEMRQKYGEGNDYF